VYDGFLRDDSLARDGRSHPGYVRLRQFMEQIGQRFIVIRKIADQRLDRFTPELYFVFIDHQLDLHRLMLLQPKWQYLWAPA
jgi:hypothetical protein